MLQNRQYPNVVLVATGLMFLGGGSAMADDKPIPARKQVELMDHHPGIDANGDGVLTATEVDTFFGQQGSTIKGKNDKPMGFRGHKGDRRGKGPGRHGYGRPNPDQLLKDHPELDTNQDGRLSREEMRAGRDLVRKERFEKRNRHMLERHPEADVDGNGRLSEEEAQAFGRKPGGDRHSRGMHGRRPNLLRSLIERFKDVDRDGNGQLSLEELRQAEEESDGPMQGGFGRKGPRPFCGKEGREGHRARLLERFPEADANGDGTLSDEEMKAHWEQWRSRRRAGHGESTRAAE